jgi:cystathionine gamma-synthase
MPKQFAKFSKRLHLVLPPQYPSLLTSTYDLVKKVFYPKLNPSRANYDAFRTVEGGYGGLLSIVFHDDAHAITFYDAIETAKGPSLGTNFTLTSPYTILAHYTEMDWAEKYGVERGLVRISVGLEEKERLVEIFDLALEAVRKSESKGGE